MTRRRVLFRGESKIGERERRVAERGFMHERERKREFNPILVGGGEGFAAFKNELFYS